jgi:hypothetical protein
VGTSDVNLIGATPIHSRVLFRSDGYNSIITAMDIKSSLYRTNTDPGSVQKTAAKREDNSCTCTNAADVVVEA